MTVSTLLARYLEVGLAKEGVTTQHFPHTLTLSPRRSDGGRGKGEAGNDGQILNVKVARSPAGALTLRR